MALSWSDISSQAWFTELAPEQKAKALDVWTQDTLSFVTDPAEREQLEAASEFGRLKYLGQPLPAQSLEEFVPIFQEQKRLKAADEQGLLTQLGGALQTGLRDVTTGLGVTFDALTGDNEELAQGLAAMNETDAVRQQNKTTQDIQFEKALAENAQQFKDAKGFWPTTKELADYVGITLSNPTAFAKMVAESAPNALVSIGAQAVGAGVGALAAGAGGGVATGGAGAIPAAFAGGTAGAVAANVPLEIPGSIRQKFLEVTKGEGAKMTPEQIKQVLDANPEIVSEGALKGTVRGTAIGVVEGLTAGVAGKVATIPERAAERAVLAETARRMRQATATRLEAADYIFKTPGAKQAMAEVASKALSDFTVGQRVAGLAGAGLIETAGEGAGELAAQVATGEEIDPTAIYQEVAAGLGMAGASTALARSIEPARQIVQRINASPELQAEKQNLTAAENLVQQAAADPNTVASVAAAKAVINQGDQNLVEKAATAVAQEFQAEAEPVVDGIPTGVSPAEVSTADLEQAFQRKQEVETQGGLTGEWKPPASDEPEVPKGFVRFYHAGAADEGITKRWLSPSRQWVKAFRPGAPVWFVDIPVNDPQLRKSFDDSGTPYSSPFSNFEADEATSARIQPLQAAPAPARTQTAETATTGSVPLMVTRGMRQQLSDLGYTKAQVNSMTPADAQNIIAGNVTASRAPAPAAEEAPVAVPDWVKENAASAAAQVPAGTQQRVKELAADRKTAKEIAAETGLDVDTVQSLRVALGIPPWTSTTTIGNAPVESPEFTAWREKFLSSSAPARPPYKDEDYEYERATFNSWDDALDYRKSMEAKGYMAHSQGGFADGNVQKISVTMARLRSAAAPPPPRQRAQVSPDITSGITDLGEAEGDIRTRIPLQTPQGAELPATEAELAGQPFATETPFQPTDLESGLTEVPPISPADITAGLEPQPPTQTTEDATLQGQVPENRIEERVQTDEGRTPTGPGSRDQPEGGGQVQAEVQTDEVTIPPQGVVPTESLPEGQVTPGGAAVPSVTPARKPRGRKPKVETVRPQTSTVSPDTDEVLGVNERGETIYWSPEAKTQYSVTNGRVQTAPWIEGLPAEALDRLEVLTSEAAPSPAAPQVSPEIRNTLQAEIASLPPVAQTRWTPDVVADAESYIQTGNQDAYKRLTRPQQNLVNRVRERLGITDEQDAQEAEMERQMRLDANTKGSPYRNQIEQSIDLPIGQDLGLVSEADFEAGMRIVEGLIRNARATVIQDTRANLLASADLNEAEKDAFRRGAQGIYSRGRAIIARDNIRATSFTASPAQAAAAVVFHELMHKGSDILKSDPRFAQEYADWLQMLNENVTDDMIRDVVARTGYRNMADWQTNPTSKLRAQEEVFVRQMERFFQRGGRLAPAQAGLLARFKEWIGRVVERALGTPIAGNLRDDILQDWGRKFIKAVQSSNEVSNVDVLPSYIGENAQMSQFMRDSLETAKTMAAAGKSSEEIRALTGWFPGQYDKKMRWELPDNEASFVDSESFKKTSVDTYGGQVFNRLPMQTVVDRIKSGKFVKLSDVFRHPALFAAYPEAANIPFFPIGGNIVQGSHRIVDGDSFITATVVLDESGQVSEESTSVILHELQHYIQNKEGFARGGSPDSLLTKADLMDAIKFRDSYKAIQKYRKSISDLVDLVAKEKAKTGFLGLGGPKQKEIKRLETAIQSIQEDVNAVWSAQGKALSLDRDSTRAALLSAINKVEDELGSSWVLTKRNEGLDRLYKRLAGEIEARDVQARRSFTPEQRQATAPYSSENIAPEDAIVVFGGDPSQTNAMALSMEFPATPTPETRTGVDRISTFDEDEKAALRSFMKGDQGFDKLKQFLGVEEGGELGRTESLLPLKMAAIDTIGFSEDKSGAPVVSKRATENAFEIARQLLDPTTNFGVTYQQEVGEGAESAATAVLQMELTRYALAMARKGDNRLLATMRQNWNSVVLGAYITATASGRILRARVDYVSDVLRTIEKMEREAQKQAKKRLQSLGMDEKEAEATVRDLDAVIQQTRLTEEQLNDLARALETSPEGRAFEKEKPAEDWAGRAVSRLQPENQRLVNQFFRELFELDQAAKKLEEISKTPNGPEASFLDSFVTDDITLPDSQEELQEFIQTKEKKIADILGKLLPRAKTDPAVAEALAKVTKPAKPKKPVQQADATSTGSENDDVSSAEDVNEATKAAAKIIDNLKAFLDKKFTKKAPKPSVYQKIKALVDKAIANPENYDFEKFQEEADKDLKSFDIDEEVQEELVAKAFTVFSRYQQKEAESIAASLIKEKVEKGPTIPEKAQDLKATVRKYLVNKERLEAAQFRSKMTDEIIKIGGIEAKTIEALVNATYNRFVKNRQAQVAKKVEAVKKALLSGSRDTLAKRMLADKGADPTDATWRREAMHVLLKNSGLTALEAREAYNAMSKKDIDTIFKVSAKMAAEMEVERTNKRVAEIIRKYEKELATPKEEAQQQQDNLRNLTKTQMRVPLELDVFKAEAARFGATPEQAERLFNLARVEADLLTAERGKSPTMLGKLVRYLQSVPRLMQDPQGRSLAIESFLRDNGYSEEQIARSKSWIENTIGSQMAKAKQAKLASLIARAQKKTQQKLARKEEEALATRLGGITGKALQTFNRDLSAIRAGLGDKEVDPSQKLAEALGFIGFKDTDYKSLAELDIKITQANLEGRGHDAASGITELYELLGRRKAPKNLGEQLGIAFNYGALSSLGSLSIQVTSPLGSLVIRYTLDLARAIVRRDVNLIRLTTKALTDSFKKLWPEFMFGISSAASTVTVNQQVFEVTRLSREMSEAADVILRRGKQTPEKRKERGLSAKPNPLETLKAIYSFALTHSQVIGRILSSLDNATHNAIKNYITKMESAKVLLAGSDMSYGDMAARLFSISTTVSTKLGYEQTRLTDFVMQMQELKLANNYNKESLLDMLAAPMPEGVSQDALDFERDLRGSLRRVIEAYAPEPKKLEKHLLKEMKRQNWSAKTRAHDRMRVEILQDLEGRVTPQAAAEVAKISASETEYEMGTHRGEEAPKADIFNLFTNLIRSVGQSVKSKHPLLGTMVLGYFGIPVNLLNRAMWFTPWGFVRLGLFKNAQRNGLTRNTYYQMSLATTSLYRQRIIEATVGTSLVAALMALKSLDDDDEEGFVVTLSGPTNKTEADAWYKNGYRKGSLAWVTKEGTVTTLNWARGPLEPLKVAFLLVGAMDDMRLNRKIGEQATGLGTTISEYLSAVLYGWSKQAAFFGAKNTIGTFLAPAVDSNAVAGSLYKLGPLVPYNGLISSVEKFIAGPDRFYGREGAIWLNLPIARSLMTERAVNALGDPQGYVPNSAWSSFQDRAWYAGMFLNVNGSPTGNDKKVYDFILQRGTGPGLPQRGNLEEKNGLMSDTKWLEFVRTRGQILKTDMIRNMPRLEALDDEALTRAYSDMSEQATRIAKRRMGFQ